MNRRTRTLRMLLLLATLGVAGIASAKYVSTNLGLTPGKTDCEDVAKGRYKYNAMWRAPVGSRLYQVNTGNQCHLDDNTCGLPAKTPGIPGINKPCTVTCSATGQCSAPLNACVIGKGQQWVQVTALDAMVYQRVAAPAPGRCQ